MLNRQKLKWGAACSGGWAAYGQKVAENMFNNSRSWLLDLPGVRITRAHELIKSPSEMNKVGRAVKGSALYL